MTAGAAGRIRGTIAHNQTGDSFIRDVEFTAGPDQLNGEGEFSGAIIRLVLRKAA